MKNKILLLLISCISVTYLFAQAQEKPLVLATASIFADMAENIGGDAVDVKMIVPIGGDPHIYEPKPSDAQLAADASLILMNGLTFEGWLSELVENSGTKAETILITEGVETIGSLTYANSTDPHAWMSAKNGLIYIENIKNALVKLVPDQEEMFLINYGVYKQQLEDMDTYIAKAMKTIPEQKRVLITSHDAFQYYGRRYGIRLESLLGTSTDADVQTSDMQRVIKEVKTNKIPALFVESTINPKLLKQIAADADIEIGGELYADSIGDKDSDAPTYLDMLQHNTDVIVKGLTRTVEVAKETKETQAEEGTTNLLLWGFLGLILIGGFFFVARKMM